MLFENYTPVAALIGGTLIGLSVAFLMYSIGRLSGISGIAQNITTLKLEDFAWRFLFLFGLILGAFISNIFEWGPKEILVTPSDFRILIGGLLVGIGTKIGHGCTSGHGVCGLSLVSKRSIYSVIVFMSCGIGTVYIMRALTNGNF